MQFIKISPSPQSSPLKREEVLSPAVAGERQSEGDNENALIYEISLDWAVV